MINWKVRVKNKIFWMSLIPAVLLLIQTVATTLGYALDLGEFGNNLQAVVNAAFGVLAILGIVIDPKTEGMSDSKRALTYNQPK